MKLLLTLAPGLSPDDHCFVVVVDWQTKRIVDQYRFEHRLYERTHKGFAGAAFEGDQLIVATEGELVEFQLAPLRMWQSHTFSFLNDVHHVALSTDRIWVCNTGLDCIEEFSRDWQWIATHHLVARFGRRVAHVCRLFVDDIRKSWKRARGHYEYYGHLTRRPAFRNVAKLWREDTYRRNGMDVRCCDFRPHVLHPNHIATVDNDLWVTLWRTGEVVSLRHGEILVHGLGRPHDGIVWNGRLYLTDCRRNRLIACALSQHNGRAVVGPRILDRTLTGEPQEGFLRGIAVAEDRLFVGLTARRGASPEQQVARIVEVDPESGERRAEWKIPSEFGLQVFSIIDVSAVYE